MITSTRKKSNGGAKVHRLPRPSDADTVLRFYEVVLKPDSETAYEPVTVTLSYTDEEANAIDPRSKRAVDEAFRRAVKVERRTHHTPESRSFLCGGVRFTRQSLITPKRDRREARPSVRAAA